MGGNVLKLLFASDSFKGSLTSRQTAEILEKAATEVFGSVECISLPVADGGEGTLDALLHAIHAKKIYVDAYDPLMRPIRVPFADLGGNSAVIEMAQVSGLPLVPVGERNPLHTTSYGTGEVLRHALDMGFRDITLAIGGSATNDGGMGFASALGIKFMDDTGVVLDGKGEDLEKVSKIDLSGLDSRIKETKLTVMCDVSNPLCGAEGAAYTYGAQKGADTAALEKLEKGMCNYRDVIKEIFSVDPDTISGSGAAGGLGAALAIFLGARMKPGIETVLDLAGFDGMLEGVDLVVTGEGRADWQSCYGKVMHGVGRRAKAKDIPVVGLCGSLGEGAFQLMDQGISSLMVTVDGPMGLSEAMEKAEDLYYKSALRMFRFIRTGMEMGRRNTCSGQSGV